MLRKLALLWGPLLLCCGSTPGALDVQTGDLVFQASRSSQSLAIQRATHSRYSHMGVVVMRDDQPYVLEAIATVRYTPLAQWIARGEDQHVVVKRLRDGKRLLTDEALARARAEAKRLTGKPYDLTFEWSDQRMYCSELVWKLYERALGIHIGEPQRLRDFSLDDDAVRRKLRERYGEHIPLDEPVISPAAMFESPLLETVAER